MSSVLKALNGHAAHKFETYVRGLMEKRGLETISAFARAAGFSNSGAVHYPLQGKGRLTPAMAEKWAEALGVSPEELLEANKPIAVAMANRPRKKSKGAVTVGPVTTPWPREEKPKPAEREVTSDPERFSIVVSAEGTAAVRLNMPDLPLDKAFKLVQALMEFPDLIGPKLRIIHEKKEGE